MNKMPPDCAIPRHVTGLYIFTVLNLLALFHISLVDGDVTVNEGDQYVYVAQYDDLPANFGPELSVKGITGRLVYIEPVANNTCNQYKPSPPNQTGSQWIALMRRNGCKFDEMVKAAEKLGYIGGIVFNNMDDDRVLRMPSSGSVGEVKIPSVFVGWTSGENLKINYCWNCSGNNYTVTIDDKYKYPDFKPYILWPFAVVVGTCFILMLAFMIFKWCREVNKKRKSRLSTKVLKKIPVKKFKKGDKYDVCAICLDDYEEGEKLRVLPCSHTYHCTCIDPWLTKNKKTCPVCKRKVIPGSNPDSDSDSEEDNGNASSSTERTPLLAGNNNSVMTTPRRSTFDNSGLPENVRPEVRHIVEVNQDSSSDEFSDSDDSDHVPRPSAQREGVVVVNREVVNRGYFKSSDEDSSEDEDNEQDIQGAVGGTVIVSINGDQKEETKTVNQIV